MIKQWNKNDIKQLSDEALLAIVRSTNPKRHFMAQVQMAKDELKERDDRVAAYRKLNLKH